MQISITTRHFDASEETKKYLSEKLEKLEKFFSKIVSAKAILIKENYRHAAEVSLSAKDMQLVAKEESEDMHSAIDLALHKLEKQLLKFKDKAKEHKARRIAQEKGYAGDEDQSQDKAA